MTPNLIDINADLGEGSGKDESIMPLISSCSIACGGHYGTETSMRTTVQLAKKYKVAVGAHPSFPDRDHFGRKLLSMTKSELMQSIFDQLIHFYAVCETEEVPVHHIKLHGALYNYAAVDAPTADAVVDAIVTTKIRPKLYVPYRSILAKKAENLLPLVFEAFIDRRYNDDLSLVDRSKQGAIIERPSQAWQQLFEMFTSQTVTSISGTVQPIVAQTYCIHSDHAAAVPILRFIHEKMQQHSIPLL
ncbi:LamB/YcsF family protein [Altibacter sp.]|uniref:LamB/YcsF family protein n=1 Tax=Altibacter sp. TaxID=2024823 RepID=UPI000C903A9A|nr:LamB/YcsF family protein [Altibacter sp.]MAP54930.1 lactam utilization protein LamB [Altibacter sp.]